MGWDAAAAFGSIAGALVLLGGTVAAIMQLKHLRLTYQIESYLAIMAEINTPELVAARAYVESLDLGDPQKVEALFADGLDHRILRLGGFLQTVSRMINLGIADPRLFAPFILAVVPMWRALRPVAEEIRRRSGYPRWLDVEVLVYNAPRFATSRNMLRGYPDEPLKRTNFPQFLDRYNADAAALMADSAPAE